MSAFELSNSSSAFTWTQSFSEDGSSLANWTQATGSWSVVSGALHVDTTAGTLARLKYNVPQQLAMTGMWVIQADVMMESSGIGSNCPMGLIVYWDGVSAGFPVAQLFKASSGGGTKQVRIENDQIASITGAITPPSPRSPETPARTALTPMPTSASTPTTARRTSRTSN